MTTLSSWMALDPSAVLLRGRADVSIARFTIDSRRAAPDVGFVAGRGALSTSLHGERFVWNAIGFGCAVVVVDRAHGVAAAGGAVHVIGVDDPRVFFARAAEHAAGNPSQRTRVVGVTGTNGKTSVTSFIAQLESALGGHGTVIGTLGSGSPTHLTTTGYTTPEADVLSARLAHLVDRGASPSRSARTRLRCRAPTA
jgi:UDP-N-acetylmuramoyl-L-alanyl-D-glutamate--2,6-diaminopimelate ligase